VHNTNKEHHTVNLLITRTHIHVASTMVPGARSVPYPCTASRINHFQRHQSIIDTERQREREREREREIDTTNRMRHRQVPFNDKTIGCSHTQSHAHVRGSPTPLHQTRDTQAVQTSIMCDKIILRRALELDETQIPSWMHDSFLDEKCFITRKSH